MMHPIEKLTIQVTKTADGQFDYVQIMSGDMFTVNVVLIAAEIVVEDDRSSAKPKPKQAQKKAAKKAKGK